MGRATTGPAIADTAAGQHRVTARHASMICGLTLAALVSAVAVYLMYPDPMASPDTHTGQLRFIGLHHLENPPIARPAEDVLLSPNAETLVAITANQQIRGWSLAEEKQLISGVEDGSVPS